MLDLFLFSYFHLSQINFVCLRLYWIVASVKRPNSTDTIIIWIVYAQIDLTVLILIKCHQFVNPRLD